MRPLVLYHANCCDGFCAAWVVSRFSTFFQDNVPEFVAVNYGEDPPDVTGRYVAVLDFSYPREVVKDMIRKSSWFVLLDHHKSAHKELDRVQIEMRNETMQAYNIHVELGTDISGAHMAWNWFVDAGKEPPPIVSYTEDRDLWKFELTESKAINAAIASYPFDFEVWDNLDVSLSTSREVIIQEGHAILRYQQQLIDRHVKSAQMIKACGYEVPIVNATCLFSEIAGALAEDHPFGICYFDRDDKIRQYSLRSRKDGVDVSEIAQKLGGGGHATTAGFELEWKQMELVPKGEHHND